MTRSFQDDGAIWFGPMTRTDPFLTLSAAESGHSKVEKPTLAPTRTGSYCPL
jgi:hypothetical protein